MKQFVLNAAGGAVIKLLFLIEFKIHVYSACVIAKYIFMYIYSKQGKYKQSSNFVLLFFYCQCLFFSEKIKYSNVNVPELNSTKKKKENIIKGSRGTEPYFSQYFNIYFNFIWVTLNSHS